MNRVLLSFFITLLLYIALFLIFQIDLRPKLHTLPKKVSRFNISDIRFIKPQKRVHKMQQKSIKHPPIQPITKRPQIKKLQEKLKKLNTPKNPIKKQKKIKKVLKNKAIKKRIKSKKIKKIHHTKIAHKRTKETNQTKIPSLMQFFAKKNKPKPQFTNLPHQIKKLYKDDFSTFTKNQKKFIKDNLGKIGMITQKYLYLRGYPYIAIKTRQEGTNLVEFYLHPNGDITDLKILKSSGYEALDKNTLETIKTAYKDYPLPKETTLIRIYVKYSIIY
ncbi:MULTISPECIES: energy transducer TonB [unclassified Nitratiruptor]|uniref:energy transducer TonB n=1 Tax=unclassified Nitratiruptor TaxID=2624044 RepID=UPI0019152AD2|nr:MULTISPECIES: energy transducer TonB [unclassified Nitratiruptor]BCD60023.1 periplasmic protein TonB [Nitratiruptor sp. YY08-10]BCD63946.1 periplasmic protein TonB [Nitratiruptor sp. YY08-14]